MDFNQNSISSSAAQSFLEFRSIKLKNASCGGQTFQQRAATHTQSFLNSDSHLFKTEKFSICNHCLIAITVVPHVSRGLCSKKNPTKTDIREIETY